MNNYKELIDNIVVGNESVVASQVQVLMAKDVDPLVIIKEGLIAGMNIVGDKFRDGEMFVPEVLMSARAMNAGMDIVKPSVNSEDLPNLGTVIIGTVKGDLHDIGKNLVVMMMESAGFKVINLGVDVTEDKFISAAKENNAKIVAMSAMLTTTMAYMDDVIKACKDAGLEVKYMVGGAPVTEMYADKIGAAYSSDASSAVQKAKEIIN